MEQLVIGAEEELYSRDPVQWPALTCRLLKQQTVQYRNTGGTSAEAGSIGFAPAFLDRNTGQVYRACFANGMPAPMHLLDGLPSELVMARDPSGRVTAVNQSVIAGFIRDGRFYTRDQASQMTHPTGKRRSAA